MAEKYDINGYNSSDFKRNSNQELRPENEQDGEDGPINEKAGEYMRELLSEKIKLNNGKFPLSMKLLDQGISVFNNCSGIYALIYVPQRGL